MMARKRESYNNKFDVNRYEMEPGRNIADYALEFAAGHSNLETKREKQRANEEHDDNGEDITDDACTEAEFKVIITRLFNYIFLNLIL